MGGLGYIAIIMELEVLPPSVDFLYFVQHFLYENRPCLLANEFVDTWKARMFWQKDGIPNIEYLRYEFGVSLCTQTQLTLIDI